MNDDCTPLSNDELWLCHLSCVLWSEPERWIRYLGRAEELLGANITHLDKADPVRRQVKSGKLSEVANYIISMGKREDSRWVFGKMETIGVEFSIQHYREVRGWPNAINWYFPPKFVEKINGATVIRTLFDFGNATLTPFYGYSDTKSHIARKKKETGSVDIQAELLGVFWLSFFDANYVTFIGKEKFNSLQGIGVKIDNGATLELGETPASVPNALRHTVEVEIGSKLFVDPKDMTDKRPGQYALTFDQLAGRVQ